MKVTVCSSMKKIALMRELKILFKHNKLDALFPDIDFTIPDSGMTRKIRKELQDKHFSKIRSSELIYVLTPDKHIGRMVSIEIGYAKALGKRIVFSQKTGQTDLDMFADDFLDTDELIRATRLTL